MGAGCCRLIPENSVTPEDGLVVGLVGEQQVVGRVGEQQKRMVDRVGVGKGGPDRLLPLKEALVAVMRHFTEDPTEKAFLIFFSLYLHPPLA